MSDATADTRPWYKRWWAVLLVFPALLLGAIGLFLFFYLFSNVPLPDDIGLGATVVLDRDGQEIGTLAAQAAREDVSLDEVPEHVPRAVMAAEDRGFYGHGGVSFRGILRALFTNARAGEIEQGGSTITQQYVKVALLSPERTFTRKAKEATLAIKLDRNYSKEEILGFYLSSVYFGRGAYGIEAAAQTYFDKPSAELTVNESALLAGMVQAPEALDPVENPEPADARRVYTLDGMLAEGWIDEATHTEAIDQGLPDVTQRQTVAHGPMAYYLDAVERELAGEISGEQLYKGLTVHTGLDPQMQELAQELVAEHVAEADGAFDSGALVSVDPTTGGVRALVGGPDFSAQPFNVAWSAVRQPGSTFKPAALTAFIDQGYHPESRFSAPAEVAIPQEEAQDAGCQQQQDPYEVPNYGDSSFGEQTVYEATRSSTNTVFVQLELAAQCQNVVDAGYALGLPEEITRPGAEDPVPGLNPNTSLVLGVNEFTPVQMAGMYATLAAEGVRTRPHLVTRVEGPDGDSLYEPEVVQEEGVEVNVARVVTDALTGVIESGSGEAADIGRPAAGKTGTTNEGRDVWFAGYVPQLVTTIWFGNLDRAPIEGSASGGAIAAPVWGEYMSQVLEGVDVAEFAEPDLSGLELLNDEPEPCPAGYRRGSPPSEADANGFFPEIIEDSEDGSGEPCVEVSPEPSPTPTPSPTPVPTVTPSPTITLPGPTESPSPSPSPEPSPTETSTGGGGGGGNGGGGGGDDGVSGQSEPTTEPSQSG